MNNPDRVLRMGGGGGFRKLDDTTAKKAAIKWHGGVEYMGMERNQGEQKTEKLNNNNGTL